MSLLAHFKKKNPIVTPESDKPIHDLEGLAFQTDDFIDKKLIPAVTDLVNAYKSRSGIREKLAKVGKVIFDRTGINVKMNLQQSENYNAWVYIPRIDSKHPLYSQSVMALTDDEVIRKVKSGKLEPEKLIGTIDAQNARVSGVYSEIPFRIFLTTRMLLLAEQHPGRIAAVIMHEVGHAYSTLYVMGYSYTQNYVLGLAQRAITKTNDSVFITEVLVSTGDNLKHLEAEMDKIAKVKNKTVQQSLILGVRRNEILSYQNSPLYDRLKAEHFSDMFVARFGGEMYLAEGLDFIYRRYGVDLKKTSNDNYALNLVMFLIGLLLLPLVILGLIIGVLGDDSNGRHTYGSTRDRLEAIQRQCVERIKAIKEGGDKDSTALDAAVSNYESIRKIADAYNEEREFVSWLHDTLFKKDQRAVYEEQQRLEKINANGVFIAAAKLEGLLK